MSREECVLQSVINEVDDMVTINKETVLMSKLYQRYQDSLHEITDGEAEPVNIKTLDIISASTRMNMPKQHCTGFTCSEADKK